MKKPKTTSAERVQAMRERRKAAGVCVDCAGPIEPSDSPHDDALHEHYGRRRSVRCRACAAKLRARHQR